MIIYFKYQIKSYSIIFLEFKNVLLSSITSSVDVSALGDMIYGYIMLIIYGINIKSFFFFSLFIISGGFLLTSISIIFNSLSFWFGRVEIIANTVGNLMVNFATYPDGIFKGLVKVLFYTILPIGFVNYLPLRIMSEFNLEKFMLVIGVSIFFIIFAFIVFYKGLKRYSSSNLMNVRV